VKTWFLCFQQTEGQRYGSVTSDPTLLDDVVISLEFEDSANDWEKLQPIAPSQVVINHQNPNGFTIRDWEKGKCEVIGDAIYPVPAHLDRLTPSEASACQDRQEPPDDGEIDDYSHWNEEAEIVKRMENPEIDGRDYPPDPYDDDYY